MEVVIDYGLLFCVFVYRIEPDITRKLEGLGPGWTLTPEEAVAMEEAMANIAWVAASLRYRVNRECEWSYVDMFKSIMSVS